MEQKRDYYEVLGIRKGATDKEIKSAYRKMVNKYHHYDSALHRSGRYRSNYRLANPVGNG